MGGMGWRRVHGLLKKIRNWFDTWRDMVSLHGGRRSQSLRGWTGVGRVVDWGGASIWSPVSSEGTSLKTKKTPSSDFNLIMAIGNENLLIFLIFFIHENTSFEQIVLFLQVGIYSHSPSRSDWQWNQELFGTPVWRRSLRKRKFPLPLRHRCSNRY